MTSNARKIKLGIVGGFQTGKSTLINCLLDQNIARTGGKGASVTKIATVYSFGEIQYVQYYQNGMVTNRLPLSALDFDLQSDNADLIQVHLRRPFLKFMDLVDTPGFNSDDVDNETTDLAIREMDILILMLNNKGGLETFEKDILKAIDKYHKPFFVIVNCTNDIGDLWNPLSTANKQIISAIGSDLKKFGNRPVLIDGKSVTACNLGWFWYASGLMGESGNASDSDLAKRIKLYIANNDTINKDDPYESLAEQSNFIPLRNIICEEDFSRFPHNFIRWNCELNYTVDKWIGKLQECVNSVII